MRSPGHKQSQRLIEGEAYRRIMAGEAPATLAEFAQELSVWLQKSHSEDLPVTLAAIEDQIQDTWHRRHELIRGGS